MTIGVIFALSQSFSGFAASRAVMFESHSDRLSGATVRYRARASLVSMVMHILFTGDGASAAWHGDMDMEPARLA